MNLSRSPSQSIRVCGESRRTILRPSLGVEYYRQVFSLWWSILPDDYDIFKMGRGNYSWAPSSFQLASKVAFRLQLPEGSVDAFDPVVYMSLFIEVKGEPTRESQSLSFVMTRDHAPAETFDMRPGPLQLTFGEPLKLYGTLLVFVFQPQYSPVRREAASSTSRFQLNQMLRYP